MHEGKKIYQTRSHLTTPKLLKNCKVVMVGVCLAKYHGLLIADRLETEIKMSALTLRYLKLNEKAMWRKEEMACTMLRLPIALALSIQTSNIHELQN